MNKLDSEALAAKADYSHAVHAAQEMIMVTLVIAFVLLTWPDKISLR